MMSRLVKPFVRIIGHGCGYGVVGVVVCITGGLVFTTPVAAQQRPLVTEDPESVGERLGDGRGRY